MAPHKRSLVSEVLGVTDPRDPHRSLNEAYRTLFNESYDAAHHTHIINLIARSTEATEAQLSTTEAEKRHDVRALQELLVEREIQSANTLTDWHAYALMMHRYGKPISGAAALMIGSLSSISSRSFQCLATQEYGADEAYVVDLRCGKHKMRHGTFVQGSGLALEFEDNSIDIMHTNRLIRMLEAPDQPTLSTIQKTRRLLDEIVRVLKPGGQLYMVESVPGIDLTQATVETAAIAHRYGRSIGDALQRRGIDPIVQPLPMYLDINCLFDHTRNFKKYIVGIGNGSFQLFARKPLANAAHH